VREEIRIERTSVSGDGMLECTHCCDLREVWRREDVGRLEVVLLFSSEQGERHSGRYVLVLIQYVACISRF